MPHHRTHNTHTEHAPGKESPGQRVRVFIALMTILVTSAVVVLAVSSAGRPGPGVKPVGDTTHIIPLNTASVADLQLLPGVGPRLAARIDRYRRAQPFKRIDDLRNVNGIGEKIARRVEPFVSFE